MYLRIHLIVLTQMMLQPSCMSSKDDLTALLPDLTRLCPGLDFCGLNQDLEVNSTSEMNSCCFGCSCDENCFEKDDCCFSNPDPEESISKCLEPDTNQNLENVQRYHFVMKEPSGGCVAPSNKVPGDNATCSPDEQAAPWGNFLPIYSKHLNKNFKNAACGRCHGADDLVEWGSLFEFTGNMIGFAESMTLFNEKNGLLNSHILYMSPNAESRDIEKQCFDDMEMYKTCRIQVQDSFNIPSNIQMDRQSIIEACESGPQARYVRNIAKVYKNVFCAICNGAVFMDDVRCEYTGDSQRAFKSPYRALIDQEHVRNSRPTTDKERKEEQCYKANHQKNASRCAELHCPLLKTRLDTGACGYRSKLSEIECMKLCLTLTATSNTEEDMALLLNMTSTEVRDALEDNSPWTAAWKIQYVAYLTESEQLEFFVCMNLKLKQPRLQSLITYTMKQLSKAWQINIGSQLEFNQEIFKHGSSKSSGLLFLTTRWSSFKSPSSQNLTIPIWKQLFLERMSTTYRSCVVLTQMMMCKQVTLSPDEYSLDNPNAVLHLINEDKILYPNEFTALADSDGGYQVRVCLKDSGYVKMEQTNGAGSLRPVFILTWILVLMDEIMNTP